MFTSLFIHGVSGSSPFCPNTVFQVRWGWHAILDGQRFDPESTYTKDCTTPAMCERLYFVPALTAKDSTLYLVCTHKKLTPNQVSYKWFNPRFPACVEEWLSIDHSERTALIHTKLHPDGIYPKGIWPWIWNNIPKRNDRQGNVAVWGIE